VENRHFRGFRGSGDGARTPAPLDAAEGLAVIRSSDRFSRWTGARVWGLVGQL